jgi:hypothetical protein
MIRVLLLTLFIASSYHDFHYSRSKILYNEETSTLQTCIHVFTDDLELAINRNQAQSIEIGMSDEHVVDSLIRAYSQDHFSISTSAKDLELEWIGFECEYDITFLYIESEPFDEDSLYTLKIDLFMEMYDDQENVLDFTSPQIQEGHILTSHNRVIELKMK